MIYQVTQGKEKSRCFNTGNPQPIQEWCCLAIVAANDSIFEVMKRYTSGGTDAGVTRVFEIRDEERPQNPVPKPFSTSAERTTVGLDRCMRRGWRRTRLPPKLIWPI